jgi:hypothetical protein
MKSNIIQLRVRTNLLHNRAEVATGSKRFQNVMASGSLATILFLVTVMNLKMSHIEIPQTSSRSIASVSNWESTHASEWKTSFWKKAVLAADRSIASIANKPTDLDQLRFGVLEGKYFIKLEAGKITELEFQESTGAPERPKYIEDKAGFLKTYGPLLAVDYESAQRTRRVVESGNIIEEYTLLGPKSSAVAKVEFKSDENGRLLSMKLNR